MAIVWRDSIWYYDMSRRSWCFTESGNFAVGEEVKVLLELHERQVRSLISSLDEQGWIKPRLDERLRSEDLKITHRLLDLLDRGASNGK